MSVFDPAPFVLPQEDMEPPTRRGKCPEDERCFACLKPGNDFCDACGKAICEDCWVKIGTHRYCAPCRDEMVEAA
jgi:hypothetical protein